MADNLIFKCGQIKGQLTRFQSFITNLSDSASAEEIKCRLEKLERIFDNFENVQDEIEFIKNEVEEDERKKFEDAYFKAITSAKQAISCMSPPESIPSNSANTINILSNGGANSSTHNANLTSQVKLPNITLPDFFGHYHQWMMFYDTFNSLIRSNTQLTNIQKFFYLQSCLKGEAAQVIQSIEISSANYDVAWTMLKERFENKKLIIHTHVKAIFELYPVKNESHNYLRKLLDNFNKHLRSLAALQEAVDKWDTLLIYILSSKLDPVTKREWEESINKSDETSQSIPTMTNFLSKRCQLLETIDNKTKNLKINSKPEEKTYTNLSTQRITCSFCKGNHFNHQCEKFSKLSVNERIAEVRKSKLCLNCLRPGHMQPNCRSINCRTCNKRHHTLLHKSEHASDERVVGEIIPDPNVAIQSNLTHTSPIGNTISEHSEPSVTAKTSNPQALQVILPTAMIDIGQSGKRRIRCRALLDSGSQSNFITLSLAKKLNLKAFEVQIPVAGINNSLDNVTRRAETELSSTDGKYKSYESFLVINKICGNMPQNSFDISDLRIPQGIVLADESYHDSKPIDVLLGANVFFDILCSGQIRMPQGLIIQNTRLGWIFSGTMNYERYIKNPIACNISINNDELHEELQKFWKIEEIENKTLYTKKEIECEKHFLNNFKRDDDGRFVVSLLLENNYHKLGGSVNTAIKRFNLLERKLSRDSNLKTQYTEFINEYISLVQAGIEAENEYPEACDVIKNDFYVDDLITGHESVSEAIKLKNEINKILFDAGFPLRKWCSNHEELLDSENSNLNALPHLDISNDTTVKTLGLVWNPSLDSFIFTVNLIQDSNQPVSKRQILSTISKIFDPLGLIGPVIVQAKLILKELWKLQNSTTVTVSSIREIQMHCFCDASELAYGACLYIRCTDSEGKHHSKLLCAKSRVSPVKNINLPRLELCGALLLARLSQKVEKCLGMGLIRKFYWSDSTIVLSWISAEPSSWKTFVANRVSEIQDLTDFHYWRPVESHSNPADIISRGANPEKLLQNDLWWSGPAFLKSDMSQWPEPRTIQISEMPEKRKQSQLSLNILYNDEFIMNKYSSFTKTQRVIAYVLRFIHNIQPKYEDKLKGTLTTNELNNSTTLLLKICQSSAFKQEIDSLSTKKSLRNSSKILSLHPFLDSNALLRVGGRIKYSEESFDRKHPILIPPRHALTEKIIMHEHIRNLHAGPLATLAALRSKYWPIHGKSTVKAILRKCVVCFRAKPTSDSPLMGNLPKSRLVPKRPFSIVGIDYAGPILIKDGRLRSRKMVKAYICIFVCFVTKAVHIELAGDLTTETFLNCLKRFVVRRGLCTDIHTDNGSNFIGAANEMKSILKEIECSADSGQIRDFLLKNTITWHRIPAVSPHQGGLWEAAVKSAKYHLVRVVGNAHFTFESMYTILCQIEAVLNSRPITALSPDPNDLTFLTPAHFLIGDSLMATSQRDVSDSTPNRLKLYERLQQVTQHFWKRWSSEYITSLQQRSKWKSEKPTTLKMGSLVVLREENLPPLLWRLGRVVSLHPGKDNIVRVVSVQTKHGILQRSVTKVSALPID